MLQLTKHLTCIAAAAMGSVLLFTQAQAISPQNKEVMEQYIAGLGQVDYEIYSGFGGAETAGAVIRGESGSTTLRIFTVNENGKVSELLSEPISLNAGVKPFTFFYNGRHLVTYNTRELDTDNGLDQHIGDFIIRDLLAEGGPAEIYRIDDVVDLDYQQGGIESLDNMLAQPSTHFLNQQGLLPRKYTHFMLSFDSRANTYELVHPMRAMDDAATDEAANLNNRAILYYYQGRGKDAATALERAWIAADVGQTTIQANQRFVKAELEVLGEPSTDEDVYYDEALQYFWQGNFRACLGVLKARYEAGLSDADVAMLGISLAYEKRWPECDDWSIELTRRNPGYLADYLFNIVQVAEYQDYPDIAARYLEALEKVDPTHPGYIAASARLVRRFGEMGDAERILRNFINGYQSPGVDMAQPMLELFKIYRSEGNSSGMHQLEGDALQGEVYNLMAYIDMADYLDLSSALVEIEPEERDGISLPNDLLRNLPQGGFGGG